MTKSIDFLKLIGYKYSRKVRQENGVSRISFFLLSFYFKLNLKKGGSMDIIAHRGASGYAPENTLSSIKKAIQMGVDGIEIDIQLTKDNKIVVFHDWKLGRTAEGNKYIFESLSDELHRLNAGVWFSSEFKEDKIPSLEDVLNLLPDSMMLNIEIKDISRGHRGIEKYLVDILDRHAEKKKNIIISSFHHNVLSALYKQDKELKLGFLTSSDLVDIATYIKSTGIHCYSYHPEVNLITREAVESLHKIGIKVFVWTVNSEEDFRYLESIGVDGVITNYPDTMKNLSK